jgi:hypothetical protein
MGRAAFISHDWKLIVTLMSKLRTIMLEVNGKYALRIGMMGRRIAIKHIQNDDLGWAKLNKTYAAYKRKVSRDKKYVLTNSFRSSIINFVRRAGYDYTAYIGIPAGFTPSKRISSTGSGSKRVNHVNWHHPKYIYFLEYGRRGGGQVQPARPLWRPSLSDLKNWLGTDTKTYYRMLDREIKRYML